MLKNRIRRFLPHPRHVSGRPGLQWLGPVLHRHELWHVGRRGIALGLAIGVFFGMLTPLAQIPLAAIAAVVLRANVPAAVLSTLVSNPLTFGPLYYFAYRLGSALLGEPANDAVAQSIEQHAEAASTWYGLWSARVFDVGKPLILGLAVLATVLAPAIYFLVDLLWRLAVMRAWRRRGERRPPGT